MTIRVVILKVRKKYYIGKNSFNKTFKILKNEHIKNLNRNDDYEFYCKKQKGFFRDILIPISEEEALNNS